MRIFVFFIFLYAFSLKAEACENLKLNEKELVNYNYAVVPGILNEFISHYMVPYKAFLMKRGVPENQIFRINVRSWDYPQKGGRLIADKIIPLTKGNKKPWVFFAHSKGALETMYFLKEHGEKIPIKKIFLIQGALDGSSFYTLVRDQKYKSKVLNFIRFFLKFSFIKSYTDKFSFEKIRLDFGEEILSTSYWDKVYIVASETNSKNLPLRMQGFGYFFQNYYHSVGDGVLQKSDHIPYFLQDKGFCGEFLDANHAELVKAPPWAFEKTQKIESFLSDLLGLKGNK